MTAKDEHTPPVAKQIVKVEQQVRTITVRSAEDRVGAVELIRQIKTQRQAVTDFFADMKAKAHATWKAITEKESSYTKVLDHAEQQVKKVVVIYDQEQEAKRVAEERRLRAIAEAEAEKERKRLEDLARRTKNPTKKADLLLQAEEVKAADVTVEPTLELSQGESHREVWKARVVDAASVPREYLLVDQKKLDAVAKATRGTVTVRGVEFYPETQLAVGV